MAKILNILRKLTRVQAREGLAEPHLLETLVAEDYLRKEGWSIDHTELESSEPHVIFVMEKEIPCCPAPHRSHIRSLLKQPRPYHPVYIRSHQS